MNKDMKKINLSFEVNEDSFNLLKTIDEIGFAQYRDHEWDTIEDFKKSDVFLDGKRTEEWFLERNFGGTYYLIDDLFEHGLVESDGESWHLTYFVTNLGKTVLNNAPDVIKSVCPLCKSKRWKQYSKNVKECLTCKTHYGETVL